MSQEEKKQDGEHYIGNKKVGGNSMIQLNFSLKTLIVTLGILISGMSGAWYDLKTRIDDKTESAHIELMEFKEDVEDDLDDIKKGINQIKDVDIKSVTDRINLVDGKVQGLIVILQSKSSNHNNHNSHTAPTNTHQPSNPSTTPR